MHPIEFKKKWGLTTPELAERLKYADFTVRSWGLKGKGKRNPHPVVYELCELLDEKWTKEGKSPNQGSQTPEKLCG